MFVTRKPMTNFELTADHCIICHVFESTESLVFVYWLKASLFDDVIMMTHAALPSNRQQSKRDLY